MLKFAAHLKTLALAGLLIATLPLGAQADSFAKPAGEIVLTVTGAISNTNAEGKAEFDLGMLQALPQAHFQTSTTWTTGVVDFKGVSLKTLLEAVGASGHNLHSIALNDYAVDVPAADAVEDGPMIAYAMNDQPMSARDKGPLWIVYPFDSKTAYRTEEVYSRAIWQLNKIDIQK